MCPSSLSVSVLASTVSKRHLASWLTQVNPRMIFLSRPAQKSVLYACVYGLSLDLAIQKALLSHRRPVIAAAPSTSTLGLRPSREV